MQQWMGRTYPATFAWPGRERLTGEYEILAGLAREKRTLDVAVCKAKLVPGLKHGGPVLQVMVLDLLEGDDEVAVFCDCVAWVVPLEIPGCPVIEIDGLPKGIIT